MPCREMTETCVPGPDSGCDVDGDKSMPVPAPARDCDGDSVPVRRGVWLTDCVCDPEGHAHSPARTCLLVMPAWWE